MDLTAALFDLCKVQQRPIIAIDGPAGAGKTTLADHLAAALSLKYSVKVIHMDDLYNGWQDAFDHHLTDTLTNIARAHQSGKKISLSRYDWNKGRYSDAEEMPISDLLILEGVGSSQQAVRPHLAASIWIEIDRTQGLERVLHRDGAAISEEMQMWLQLQDQHFREEESEKTADFVLTN
jgi:uridine kinase